ncbi:phage tail tape measure protein [Alkanindiges illinoisensis]|uniref:phage tail tape measure protein n=1 Tax=Alkanindiges illinoisensis TaxID=197183 RepID=UPI00047A098A|nr:phage tail tape measure protein [Alkanindiges illinoisensis]
MKTLKLEVIFGAANKLSPALRTIVGSSKAAANALRQTKQQIKELEAQQGKVDGYIRQKKAVQDSARALKDMQDKIKSLRQQMATNPSAALTRDFDKSVAAAKRLKQQHEQNSIQLQRMRADLNQAGLSTNNLANHQQRLRTQLNQSNQGLQQQQQQLQHLNQLQQNYQNTSGKLRTAAMYGAGAAMTGIGAMYQFKKPINESKHYETETYRIASLGLGDQVTKESIKHARAMKTFGTSTVENLTLMRDGLTAFADVHHAEMAAPILAKMKFGNEAMYGNEHGAENEKKFMDMLKVIEMRNGLKSEAAFKEQANIIQQVITATGGRVQGEEWLNAIKTGGIAAKGLDNKAFYYKMEPFVQEMGGHRVGTAVMSAYQNLYQGRTTNRAMDNLDKFGLISDSRKVQRDKAGQLAFLDVGAIKGADLFKRDQFAWMEQILVPALKAKGITKEGDIIDAIGSIFSNRTASNLFATMYQQRTQVHKNAKLNEGADNIDQIYDKAKDTTAGKELEAKAKLHDAYLDFGQTILPIYTQALETATGALKTFTEWLQQNPALAKMLGVGLLGIAASLIVIGGALAVFSPLILGMFSLRLIMASLGTGGTLLTRIFSVLPTVFNAAKSAFFGLGRIFLWVGRLFLMNPIGLAITAIAAGAYLIYKNWEPIYGFFSDLGTSITEKFTSVKQSITDKFAPIGSWFGARMTEAKTAFGGGIGGMSKLITNWSPLGLFYSVFAKVLSWFGVDLPAKFTDFGSLIINGLINGLTSGFEKLKGVWANIKNAMPSFSFGTSAPAYAGLSSNPALASIPAVTPPLVNKIKPVQLQTRPAAAPVHVQGDTNSFVFHTQPGQSPQQIAQQVEQILTRRDQQKQARARNSYKDHN